MCLAELVKLFKKKDYHAMEHTLRNASETELTKAITELFAASTFDDESILSIKAIFAGCMDNSKCFSKSITFLYKKSIKLFEDDNLDKKLLAELLCVLSNEAVNLEQNTVVALCELLLDWIMSYEQHQCLCWKLFQKIIEVLPQHTTISWDGLTMSGFEFKQSLIRRLCSFQWPAKAVVNIVAMLRDVNLNAAETDVVVKKVIKELQNVDLQGVPPLVFQSLVLATNVSKAQCILDGILARITSSNLGCPKNAVSQGTLHSNDNIKQIEGTILLYIGNAMKQNQFLGKSVLKAVKNVKATAMQERLTPFFIGLSLLLVQDGRLCGDVLSSLRSLILKVLEDQHKRKCRKSLLDRTKELSNIRKLLSDVVNNCALGWDYILEGLLQLGFNLMTAFGPKAAPFGKGFQKELRKSQGAQNDACEIGINILCSAFKTCKLMRQEIVNRTINSIQTNLTAPAHHYIKLLKSIAKSYPQALLQCSEKLKIMLDDVPLMHPCNAEKLMTALLPLLKINANLRSSVILILRKSLSSRIQTSRLCALHGFLILLENFPLSQVTTLSQISSQSSQSIFSSASIQSSTQHSSPGATHNHMLCMEIVQAIKRCLVQQYTVRVQLYRGLSNVILNNPRLSAVVLEAFLDHLQLFYEDDHDILPPVSIKSCISKTDGNILEPLSLLLATISSITSTAKACTQHVDDEEIIDDGVLDRITNLFDSLTQRLCKCEVDDFSAGSSSSQSNESLAFALVLSLYQVLMEHWITVEEYSKVLELFESYKKCYDGFAQNKSSGFDKKLAEVMLSSSSFSRLTAALCAVVSDDGNVLSLSDNFSKHVMWLLHTTLLYLTDHGYLEGLSKKMVFDEILKISQNCFHKFMTEKNSPEHCTVLLSCLECFHLATKFVNNWHPNKFQSFLAAICGDEDPESQRNLNKLTKQLQRVVISFVSSDGPMSTIVKKLTTELLALLEVFFLASVSNSTSESQQFAEWWQNLCVNYEIEDYASCKRIVHLHLLSSLYLQDHPEILFRDFATDINIQLRSSEDEGESQPSYKIVTAENALQLVPVIMKHLESVIFDCDWLLAYVRGSGAPTVGTSDDDATEEIQEDRRKIENNLCVRICTVGVGLLDLLSASISSVPAIDSLINGLTTVFNFLTQFSKYYLWLCGQSYGNIPSRFEKLTSFVGSEMMRPIYAFIMHAQSIQTSKLSDGKAKKSAVSHTAGKAKVLRESKGIARLVFAIEQHEHNLIILARRSKIDLMRDYHLPTSRDFRIRTDVIHVTMNEQEASKDDNDEADADDEDREVENASKRPRMDEV